LALLLGEPGADQVRAVLPGALISTVNFAEVISKLCERGVPADEARLAVETIGADIIEFSADHATLTGAMRVPTKFAGLSLGDRACLALAKSRGVPAITADTAWARIADINVVLIRETRSISAKQPDFRKKLLGGPKFDDGLEIERDKDTGRAIDLSDPNDG
jgi:PIN domain nuclease of toxin-antitoxin system